MTTAQPPRAIRTMSLQRGATGRKPDDAHGKQHDGEEGEDGDPDGENHRAAVVEPALLVDRLGDVALERGEALGIGRPFLGDPVAELGEPLRLIRDDAVDHVGDVVLERRELRAVSLGDLEVGHVCLLQPAEGRGLGRDRRGLVTAAPDQVEQRRGELVRADGRRWRSSGGTSAGSRSDGGSCSYSRS